MKSRKNKVLIALISLVTFSLMAVTTATVAWFSQGPDLSFGNGEGKVNVAAGSETQYYESGSGNSIDDPYIISNRNHLYNLAWLQYIGTYNSPNIQQKYFKLKNDIDMVGMTLPPIGTQNYPFLGHFDGNNKTIYNLTVSNDNPLSASNDFGVMKPSDTALTGTTPSQIVGFFGVVGQLPSGNLTFDSSVVSMADFTLDNLTVKSETSQTLIGLAGGYVDGEMSNIKISTKATLNVNGDSQTASLGGQFTNISDYGLVGYSTKKGSAGSYKQEVSRYYDSENPNSGGAGNKWGGSIDMYRLFDRLSYVHDRYAVYAGNGTIRETTYLDTNDSVLSTETTAVSGSGHFKGYSGSDYSYTFNENHADSKDFMYMYGDVPSSITSGMQTVQHVSKKQTTVSGQQYKIKFEEAGSGFYIYAVSGNTTYYVCNSSGSYAVQTNRSLATVWTRTNTSYANVYQYSSVANGRTYYLQFNTGTLTTLTTSNTYGTSYIRTNSSGYIYANTRADGSHSTNRYLIYNNGWKTQTSAPGSNGGKVTEADNPIYYLNTDSVGTLSAGTNSANATEWLFDNGKIFTIINNNLWYLDATTSALSITDAKIPNNLVSWTYSQGNGIYFTSGSNYYISMSGGAVSISNTLRDVVMATSSVLPSTNTWQVTAVGNNTQQTVGADGFRTSYFPLNVSSTDNFTTLTSNPGYVISGKASVSDLSDEANLYDSGDIRVSRYATSNLSSTSTVYSINGSGKISDMSNFEKYTDARTGFNKMLTDDPNWLYGLHFMDTTISNTNTVTIQNAMINGETIPNFVAPKSCIDFKAKTNGYINFFAGTYFSVGYTNENSTFFSLHHINRSTNPITIKEISKIYKKANGDYIYKYTDNSYSETYTDESQVFDMSWVSSPSTTYYELNALYYFEIPVNSGEYALGAASAGTGAYLMYLDVSASSSNDGVIRAYSVKTTKDGHEFPSGVDFGIVSYLPNGGGSIAISIPTGNSGTIEFTMQATQTNASNITIDSTLTSDSTYEYISTSVCESGPPGMGEFTLDDGGDVNAMGSTSSQVQTVIYATVIPLGGSTHQVKIVDRFDGGHDYYYDNVSKTESQFEAEVPNVYGLLNTLRSLDTALTIERAGGRSEEFNVTCVFSGTNNTTITTTFDVTTQIKPPVYLNNPQYSGTIVGYNSSTGMVTVS